MSTSLILIVYFVYFLIASTLLWRFRSQRNRGKMKKKHKRHPTISTFLRVIKTNLFCSLKIGHRMQHLSEGSKGRQVGSGGDGERWGSDRGSRGSLNEQIALVLMRLQEDMQNVLQRLHKLETLTASQVAFLVCLVFICR